MLLSAVKLCLKIIECLINDLSHCYLSTEQTEGKNVQAGAQNVVKPEIKSDNCDSSLNALSFKLRGR